MSILPIRINLSGLSDGESNNLLYLVPIALPEEEKNEGVVETNLELKNFIRKNWPDALPLAENKEIKLLKGGKPMMPSETLYSYLSQTEQKLIISASEKDEQLEALFKAISKDQTTYDATICTYLLPVHPEHVDDYTISIQIFIRQSLSKSTKDEEPTKDRSCCVIS